MKKLVPVFLLLLTFSAAEAQLNTAEFHFNSGIEFRNNHKAAEAAAAFNKAISLNKYYDAAYVELGHLYSGAGNHPNAKVLYKKALLINPKNTEALTSLGKMYKNITQDIDSSIYFYSTALKIDSTNKETYTALAWLYNAQKDYDSGIAYATKALEIDNNFKPAYGELGHAFRSTKRYAEAIEQFKKNLAVSEVDVAYLYTGYCYTELNDKAGAMEQYEALLKINEKMAGALKKKIDSMQ